MNLIKLKKSVFLILVIYGSASLFYIFYRDILLRNTRIFKSCPYDSYQFTINSNSQNFKNFNNKKENLSEWMISKKLLVQNPETNRCEHFESYFKKGKISLSFLKQIENYRNIKNLITEKYVILKINTDYKKVSCPKSSFIIGYFGQSNSANYVNQKSKATIPKNLYQYNWKNNSCYQFKEPLLGSNGEGGNSITSFATSIAKNYKGNILIVPYGIGGTTIESWAHGELSLISEQIYKDLRKRKLNVDLFLLHQGETNSSQLIYLNSVVKSKYSKPYLKNLLMVIDQTKKYFPRSYFGVSLVSFCGNTKSSKYIVNAQKKVAELRENVYVSANSDSLNKKKYRTDGCHFNQKGVRLLGAMYEKSFKKNIFNY